MEEFFLENGVRRRGQKKCCESCKKEFVCRINSAKRFCSKKCAGFQQQNKVQLTCAKCSKTFTRISSRLKSSKHQIYFCSRECKEFTQSLEGRGLGIRPEHYGTGGKSSANFHVHKFMKKHADAGCSGCGETKRYLLSAHHKDGNRANNKPSNLEVVCGNCHIKRHLRKIDGEWTFNTSYLTPIEEIEGL